MVFETLSQFMSKIMFFHGFVNEFNGFPNPLTKEEELEYFEKMKNGDNTARDELINHNLRLIVHISKKYSGAAESEELLSVGSIGLIKAIDSYQPDKGSSISTYASRCIENEILMLLRANKKHKVCVSVDETIGEGKDGTNLTLKDIIPQSKEKDPDIVTEKHVMVEESLKIMKEKLSKRDYQIMVLRYGLVDGIERSQQEVADLMNISRSYISRIENKVLLILREEFKSITN